MPGGHGKKPKSVPVVVESYITHRPTPDDWYPTFDDGTVRLSMQAREYEGRLWCQISVWGNDDFFMYKTYDTREDMEREFDQLPLIITKTDLRDRGFMAG